MQNEHLRIEVDGAEIDDLYDDLVLVEVELDDVLASMFRLSLAILPDADGAWRHLDDERLALWRKVVITAGFEDDAEPLLTGYITHSRPEFAPEVEACRLEIWGLDASVLMDREEQLRDWPNKKDSDIAGEMFSAYGLTPDVADTAVIHDEEISTIIQRETDIQFLKRLALRNGFECYVDGEIGYFRPPRLDDTSQPVLAVHFGDDTNVHRFSAQANALVPANVTMFQVHPAEKEILDATSEPGRQPPLGAVPSTDQLLGTGIAPGHVYVGQAVTTGTAEMAALCQGLHDRGEWFVTGEGEVLANQYGTVLRPHRTVTVKGIGETYSGTYFVTHVTHGFTPDGYSQVFRVKRNALVATGAEDFSADLGLF